MIILPYRWTQSIRWWGWWWIHQGYHGENISNICNMGWHFLYDAIIWWSIVESMDTCTRDMYLLLWCHQSPVTYSSSCLMRFFLALQNLSSFNWHSADWQKVPYLMDLSDIVRGTHWHGIKSTKSHVLVAGAMEMLCTRIIYFIP